MSNPLAKCTFFNARFFNFLPQGLQTYKNIIVSHLLNPLFIGLFITLIMLSNVSAATLTYSDNLIIRDIDDKAVEHGLFSKKKTFELSPGVHSVVLRYKDVFEDIDFAEERLVKSDYFVVKFTLEDQQDLFLSTININNLAQAERFIKVPELTMVDEQQKALVLVLEKLSDYELAKQVTKVVTNISETEDKHFGAEQTINVKALDDEFNNKVINEVDAVPMLKYWWKKANEAQRATFIKFIDSQK